MATPFTNAQPPKPQPDIAEIKKILQVYDTNKDGKLDAEEVLKLRMDFQSRNNTDLLHRYDQNKDGQIDDNELNQLHEDIKTTDTNIRYASYFRYLTNVARYSAYTSDVGESFRPIIHPRLVTASYAISWAYVIGDVAYEGYKARHHHGYQTKDVGQVMVKRSVFQSVASMALPAFLIHTQVKLASHAFKKIGRFQKWGPTIAGLCLIPALPYLLDHPVEKVVDWTFDRVWPGPKTEESHHEKHE